MTEKCTITISLRDKQDHYREEDWVKDIWPRMLPWFTKRHGVTKGSIDLEDGSVIVSWSYEIEHPNLVPLEGYHDDAWGPEA